MPDTKNPVNLRTVAQKVGLAPCSVSAILNDTAAAKAIPQSTKNRVFRAAEELNYRPNFWARSLRTKRTRMVAAVAHDFGCATVAQVVAGVQNRLHEKGYLLALGTLDVAGGTLSAQFQQRGIEGVVAINQPVPRQFDLPIASVELGHARSSEFMQDEVRSSLAEMGKSAADMIIWQIENRSTSRRLTVKPHFQPAYFQSTSALQTGRIVQESV